MKQLPIRGKKKFPKCKKASRKTNRTASLPGQRKDLTSRLFILGKGACCAGHRRDESYRGLRWEGDKFLWPDVELTIVFRVGGPTKCFIWYCPRCQEKFPDFLFLLCTLNNRCDPKNLGTKAIIFYIPRNTCYLKTTAVILLVDGKILSQ